MIFLMLLISYNVFAKEKKLSYQKIDTYVDSAVELVTVETWRDALGMLQQIIDYTPTGLDEYNMLSDYTPLETPGRNIEQIKRK
jgi:hypothetical protein